MAWLRNFDIYTQGLIVSSFIIFAVFVFNLFIFVSQLKPNKNFINYTYSFSSGFLIITAIVGQFVSARSQMTAHWQIQNISNNLNASPNTIQTLITMLVIGIGFIIGVLISFISKVISVKLHQKQVHVHSHEVSHSHALETKGEHVESHTKGLAGYFMVIAHRIPAGIAMGMLISVSNQINSDGFLAQSFAFSNLVAFIFHLFPESLLLYLSLVKAKKSKLYSFLVTFLFMLVFIPLIFIGITIGNFTSGAQVGENNPFFVVMPILFSCISAILIWVIISELIPIFIHIKSETKQIYFMTFTFMAGILVSCLIQLVHFH